MRRGQREFNAAGGAGAIGPNGKPVESVWNFPRPPVVDEVDWNIRVVHGGETVVDAPRAFRVLETSQAPAYYIDPQFLVGDHLSPVERRSGCEWKGIARYANVSAGGRVAVEAAWAYQDPNPAFRAIRGCWAFYAQRLDECWVDDERVDPNEGDFYGGWITANVTGPFKGGTGTLFW